MTILHVAAWWPSRVHPTHGNFVEKHVRAVARQHDCTVIAVQEDPRLDHRAIEPHITERDGYRTVLVYYGRSTGLLSAIRLGTRVRAYLRAVRLARKHLPVPDLVHGHILVDGGIVATWLGRYWRRPVVISEHHHAYQRRRALPPLRAGLAKWACRSANAILPVTDRLGQAMRDNGLEGSYRPVSNVVRTDLFEPAGRPLPPPPPLRLLHVSNFVEPHKNVPGLLRVIARLIRDCPGQFQWTIAGDGDHVWLQRQIREQAVPAGSVVMSGPHSEVEIAELLRDHHAFVLFSRTENQPVVLLEAQCAGLPCIATRVGGVDEILEAGRTGILVDPEDEDGLYHACRELLHHYSEYDRAYIAQRARERYGEPAVAAALDAIYTNVR